MLLHCSSVPLLSCYLGVSLFRLQLKVGRSGVHLGIQNGSLRPKMHGVRAKPGDSKSSEATRRSAPDRTRVDISSNPQLVGACPHCLDEHQPFAAPSASSEGYTGAWHAKARCSSLDCTWGLGWWFRVSTQSLEPGALAWIQKMESRCDDEHRYRRPFFSWKPLLDRIGTCWCFFIGFLAEHFLMLPE